MCVGKVHDLRAELTSDKKDPRHQRKKVAMKKVVANMTMGNDMSSLYQEVIACMSIPDLEVKKMVYLFLINYARARTDIASQSVNGFEDDVNDTNPLVRAMAIRTMGYIYVEQVIESLIDPLRHCLRDQDPYVRKTAAMAVLKLSMYDRSLVEEEKFLEMLKDLLADGNPSVVANAVAALTEISERSPHIKLKLNMKIANKLITAMNECNEWGQTYILESLMYVTPQDTNDAETVIERILPRLQHGNSGVVLASIKVIAYMMNYVAKVETLDPILRKLSPPLVTLLTSGPEVQYITLRNIQLLLQRWPTILQNQLRSFFCKYDDPIYVKLAKLEVILSLTTEENSRVVLTELADYATEIDVNFVRKAVRSIGRIAIKIELAADKCVRTLLDLIQTKVNYVVQEAIIVIRDIFRKYPNRYESIIGTLCENLDSLEEPEARAAMIWIIGQYADRIDNSDEVLAKFLDSFLDDTAEVQLALLTAVVKLFIMRPTAGQGLVPKVLKWATEEVDSPDIRDRGFIYWRLLSTDPEMARTVVLSDKSEISAEGEKLDTPLLEELLLQIGTLSSIYRKPPSTFIPFAKRRVLGVTPALSRLQIAAPPVSRLPRTNAVRQQEKTSGNDSDTPHSSSTQLGLDVNVGSNGGGSGGMSAGMSNPYINDIIPGPMSGNDAVLIDLLSMDDDDYNGGTAINSAGMAGFNGNFGSSGFNISSMANTSNTVAVGGNSGGTQQALNNAFSAAGLDALSNMKVTSASSLNRLNNNNNRSSSPAPDLSRQFTSSFEISSLSEPNPPAGNTGLTSPFSLPDQQSNSLSLLQGQAIPEVSSSQPTASASYSLSASLGDPSNNKGLLSHSVISPSSFFTANSSSAISTSPFTPISQNQSLNLGSSAATAIPTLTKSASSSAFLTSSSSFPVPANTVISATAATTNKDIDSLTSKMYNASLGSNLNSGNNDNSQGGATPYVPAKQVLLDTQQTQGLEILGAFARRQGQIQMEMSFVNKSSIAISDFAIQFNKNTYGIMPGGSLNAGTLSPMSSIEVTLPLTMNGPTMAMQPLTNIQIAIKCTAGIFYFQTQYSLHVLLEENGQSDQGMFLRMWKDMPESMQGSHIWQNLRFSSMEDMRNKLNMNNVFTVAQRSVGNATHFYTSSKMCDGSMFYSEIKVANDFQAAAITTKSSNTQVVPLYQKAIEDICTAF